MYLLKQNKYKWTASEQEEFLELWGTLRKKGIIMVGKSGQGMFCERLNLPDCAGLGMEGRGEHRRRHSWGKAEETGPGATYV